MLQWLREVPAQQCAAQIYMTTGVWMQRAQTAVSLQTASLRCNLTSALRLIQLSGLLVGTQVEHALALPMRLSMHNQLPVTPTALAAAAGICQHACALVLCPVCKLSACWRNHHRKTLSCTNTLQRILCAASFPLFPRVTGAQQ
jgi:hypothetical protein